MILQQQQLTSLALASLITIACLTACSDRSADKPETRPVRGEQNIKDWQAQAQLASEANIARGKQLLQMCTGCHGINEGDPSPAGPSLYRIAGRPVGSLDSYPYTQSLKNSEKTWTVENFDQFIASPQEMFPGTGMAFTGIKNSEDRLAIIAFVASNATP